MAHPHLPIATALYGKLTSGTAITDLLSSGTAVFEDIAPENVDEPFIVFNEVTTTVDWTLEGVGIENTLWQIRAVTRGPSSAEAGTIVAEIDNALNDQALTVVGYTQLNTMRTTSVHRVEVIDGERFSHSGHLYSIKVDPD